MRALVVPAAADQPCTVIEWQRDGDLLGLLYGAIGCDAVHPVRYYRDGVQLTVWAGLYKPAAVNDRLQQLLQLRDTQPIVGTVVITEGFRPDGATRGLRESLLADLKTAMQAVATQPAAER